jgi:hypothetical protein
MVGTICRGVKPISINKGVRVVPYPIPKDESINSAPNAKKTKPNPDMNVASNIILHISLFS